MAQINISESICKKLYYNYFDLKTDFFIYDGKEKNAFLKLNEYLKLFSNHRFVVKPDYTISGRAKKNLVGINLNASEVKSYIIKSRKNKFNEFTIDRFIVSPYIEHNEEFYISLTTKQKGDELLFSSLGGVDIENNWKTIRSIFIPLLNEKISYEEIKKLNINSIFSKLTLSNYINQLLLFFREYGFTYLEINPLVFYKNKFHPLDFKGRLDDCEFFNLKKHIDIEILLEHKDQKNILEEEKISKLDKMTGASLKFKIIDPNAKIWPLVAGGGASIVYFDSLVDKGYGKDIAFYGEYSGNPTFEIVYEYTKIIINLMLKNKMKNKIFLICGANANFTDVGITFRAIIKALEERVGLIRDQKINILVRRGGPGIEEGLNLFKNFKEKYNLSIYTQDSNNSMTQILNKIKL